MRLAFIYLSYILQIYRKMYYKLCQKSNCITERNKAERRVYHKGCNMKSGNARLWNQWVQVAHRPRDLKNVLLLFSHSCPHFSPIAFHCPAHSSSPTLNPRSHGAHPWVPHMCSLTCPFPFFPPISHPPLPLWPLSVLYFHVFRSLLFTCLFYWLGSTYMWDYMVFVFYHLAYFT